MSGRRLNYLYFTDYSLQLFKFHKKGYIIFKYGLGSSKDEYNCNRTERRKNCNKPTENFETFFKGHNKNMETSILNKLRQNDKYFNFQEKITGSEFFSIKEECCNEKQLVTMWCDLQDIVIKYQREYLIEKIENNTEEVEEDNTEVEEKKNENDENDINNIDFSGIKIHNFKFNDVEINFKKKSWVYILQYILQNCNYNIDDLSCLKKGYIENKKRYLINNDIYFYALNTNNTIKNIIILKNKYNINLELQIIYNNTIKKFNFIHNTLVNIN
jgi:hypothetical protein